ncbi:MAG: sodium/proton antiporter, partial [Oceanospirillaceae bacterium]|nr:sodium/proton antiporter [Oceanospirillaceae bacterium]
MHQVLTLPQAFRRNFLGNSPIWYKQVIIGFLILNPVLLAMFGPTVAGWVLIFEFIFTLALALKCYPLQPGGLLAIEAIAIGLASPDGVYHEVSSNLQVILLLMFMVAGIYFMKDMLLAVFTRFLVGVKSKTALSVLFSFTAAVLSAFLDALTVTAVLISVGVGFYSVYHKVASNAGSHEHNHNNDDHVVELHREDLDQFRSFLRSLLMHGAVGTALGGVTTLVGEPQNLLIAEKAGWEFIEFFIYMAPVTMPVLVTGLLTCILTEKLGWFSYGAKLPAAVRTVLEEFAAQQRAERSLRDHATLIVQGIIALLLVLA